MTRDVIRALGRRWYVIVLGLLMTVGLAWGAYRVTPPTYTASGLVLLLPSPSAVGVGGNPFLALSDLDQPAGILVAYFSGATAEAEVKAHAPTAKYQVMISSSTRGPIIEVDVTDKTAAGALGTLDYITGQIPAELSRLQAQVDTPTKALITSMPLTVDTKAKADYSGTIRIVISAVVLGLLVTGIVAFALDGLLLSRRARRLARAEAAPAGEVAEADEVGDGTGEGVGVPEGPIAPEEQSPATGERPETRVPEAPVSSSPEDDLPDQLSEDRVPQLTGPVPLVGRQET